MMRKAYILIETAMGMSREVNSALQDCDWVEYAERVTGPYDIVGIAQGSQPRQIEDLVKDGLKSIEGVIRVVVCPISTVLETAVPAVPVGVS
jgi:DNA-binding Lrp family transcriptional regulator